MILITLQITGKEMCSLPKEEFLARAPAFMGDILWAHLEILQKDVDRGANIENVPSNYSDSSFVIPDAFQRTYTQLDSVVSQSQTTSMDSVLINRQPHYTQRSMTGGCYPTSVADYVSNNGSTVDSSSEFSYQMDIKYSPAATVSNQVQNQINNGRVPSYPPPMYNEQFSTENMWPYQSTGNPHEGWHQPHEYPGATPPGSNAAPPSVQPPVSSQGPQTPMHHHPALLQVRNFLKLATYS